MKKIDYLAIIPARKGSKRLKNKNLKKIGKKTLLDLTIEAALKSTKIKKIILTTDIKKYLKIKNKKIFTVSRPNNLVRDSSTTESAIEHAVKIFNKNKNYQIDNIVLLQPTSPLRNFKDINEAIRLFINKKCDSLLSAYVQKICTWKKKGSGYYLPKNYLISKYKTVGGQFQKEEIIENGAIYIFNYYLFLKYKVRLFKRIGIYFMNKKNSVEIDTAEDFDLAKLLY